jgi:hypothetical protein
VTTTQIASQNPGITHKRMISVDDLSVHLKLPAWQRALIVGLTEIDVHKKATFRAAEVTALSRHAQIHSATIGSLSSISSC